MPTILEQQLLIKGAYLRQACGWSLVPSNHQQPDLDDQQQDAAQPDENDDRSSDSDDSTAESYQSNASPERPRKRLRNEYPYGGRDYGRGKSPTGHGKRRGGFAYYGCKKHGYKLTKISEVLGIGVANNKGLSFLVRMDGVIGRVYTVEHYDIHTFENGEEALGDFYKLLKQEPSRRLLESLKKGKYAKLYRETKESLKRKQEQAR